MKKLFTIFTLFAFATLQSCTQEDIAPDSNTPAISAAGVNLAHVVAGLKENFVMGSAKAILVKPADNNPNTNLTTLYFADAQGRIAPLIENFEVRDVRVTTNGIYVLTNYAATAFFIKPDNSWVELKNVGIEAEGKDAFKGENDNGDLVFANGAILNTTSLVVNRSQVLPAGSYIATSSGNLSVVVDANNNRSVKNTVTNVEHPIYSCQGVTPGWGITLASVNNNNMALISNCYNTSYEMLDMKTGTMTWIDNTLLSNIKAISRTEEGVIAAHLPYFNKWDGVTDINKNVLTELTFRYSPEYEGVIVENRYSRISNLNLDVIEIVQSAQGTILRGTNSIQVGDREILSGVATTAIKVDDTFIYYTGTKNGNPISGAYNLNTNTDLVLDTQNNFTDIQPL